MESFRLMMEAGDFIPGHVKPWLYWLQLVLFLGPVLFLKYVPARYLFVAQIFNSITAYVVFVVEGNTVSKLFGVGHFFWLVPLWFLANDIRSDKWVVYRGFALVATITMVVSLVLDVRDTALWISGDRASVLVDVPDDHPLAD